jgi:NADH-quinone oxidoreductase subunit A
MGQYLPIVLLMLLAVAFGAISFVASRLLAPRRPEHRPRRRPTSAASCPSRDMPERFPVSFYLVAMLLHHVRHRDHLPLPRTP